MFVTNLPLLSIGAAAVYPDDEGIRRRLTFESQVNDDVFCAYRVVGGRIWIPRELSIRELAVNPGLDNRDPGRPLSAEFPKRFRPRFEEQEHVVMASVDWLTRDCSHILEAPTGYGKTILGVEIARRLGVRTLIVTTKEDIIEQWAESVRLLCPGAEVGQWRGDTTPSPTDDFVIGLVQSIMKGPDRYPARMFRGFGLVIVDECHRMGADGFSQAMWWLPAKLRLGLSATPNRKDGRDFVFRSHIGDVKVKGTQQTLVPKVLLRYSSWQVPRRKKASGEVVQIKQKAGRTMHLSNIMAADKSRNRMIARFLVKAVRNGRHTIVFADTLGHLEALHSAAIDAGITPGRLGYYVGLSYYGSNQSEARKVRDKHKRRPVVLATYQMASEATNLPWLDTCVFATPRSDVVQIVGRIRRVHPGKKQPVVYDIVDADSWLFRAYAKKRRAWYVSIGANIVQLVDKGSVAA